MYKSDHSKKQKWQARLQDWQSSGKTQRCFCREGNINPSSFGYWKKKLLPKLLPESFVEIKDSTSILGIEMEVKGILIRVQKEFDSSTFLKCIALYDRKIRLDLPLSS